MRQLKTGCHSVVRSIVAQAEGATTANTFSPAPLYGQHFYLSCQGSKLVLTYRYILEDDACPE